MTFPFLLASRALLLSVSAVFCRTVGADILQVNLTVPRKSKVEPCS